MSRAFIHPPKPEGRHFEIKNSDGTVFTSDTREGLALQMAQHESGSEWAALSYEEVFRRTRMMLIVLKIVEAVEAIADGEEVTIGGHGFQEGDQEF